MATLHPASTDNIPNGSGAAAILAAGIGCMALGVFALAGDASAAINHFFSFYKPSGALSGVSTTAVIVWLISWWGLSRRWSNETIALAKVNTAAFAMLIVGLLLTFPPFMDLVQGK